METNLRTVIKTMCYRTAVAVSIFLASLAMNYGAGFGIKFVILVYTLGFVSFFVHERLWLRIKWGMIDTYDTHRRTTAKTVTWRLWSLIVLFVFGMIIGLKSSEAFEWTVVTNILFVVIHYTHERIWNIISWNKIKKEKLNEEVVISN
jgi:uncharacterized membrane protein